MKTLEVADHPCAVVKFPIHRTEPVVAIHYLPAFRKPPTKILVTVVAHKLEIFAICDETTIECVVLKENLVRRLFIVESEIVVFAMRRLDAAFVRKTLDLGLWTLDFSSVSQPKQSTFDFGHSLDFHSRLRRSLNRRCKLIAKQMFDVVNQQLLVLHFVLES